MRSARLSKHVTFVALALLVPSALGMLRTALAPNAVPEFEALCASGQPYFMAASYRGQSASNRPPDKNAPSILLFQDTPRDNGHLELASFAQTGAVWGLAYDRRSKSAFAATYHKRGMPYGAEGPGGVYRIDLTTGDISTFAVVPNAGTRQGGGSMSRGDFDHNSAMRRLVGKTALGDIDLSDDGAELFVMNLDDRSIYRYDVATGALLGTFPHGAAGEPWSRDARPFALAYWQGHVYHGVVNSEGSGTALVAKVYRSLSDGSDMTEVVDMPLRYLRDSVRLPTVAGSTLIWGPWSDDVQDRPGRRDRLHVPQPMLTDIVFSPDGTLSLALRDRYWDLVAQWIDVVEVTPTVIHGLDDHIRPTPVVTFMPETGLGFGDVLRGVQHTSGYTVTTDPEHYDDRNGIGHDESALGGLACVAETMTIAATAFGIESANSERNPGEEGVYWLDVQAGNRVAQESLSRPGVVVPYQRHITRPLTRVSAHGPFFERDYPFHFFRDVASLGDIETLCGTCFPEEVVPTPSDVPTSESPTTEPTQTAAPTDTPTATAVPPTPTAEPSVPVPTPEPGPIFLPLLLHEQCDPATSKADVVLVLDASTSMEGAKHAAAIDAARAFVQQMRLPDDRVGVVAFNTAGFILSPLSGDSAAVDAAIGSLTLAPGTRIDVGLSLAAGMLSDVGVSPDRSQAVVVLTDGLQFERPELPLQLARTLEDRNVVVFAVGLGTDVDAAYLGQLTSDRGRLFLSPDPADLSAIYVALARLIPCPASDFWPVR